MGVKHTMTKWTIYSDARASGEVCYVILEDGALKEQKTQQLYDIKSIADGEYGALIVALRRLFTQEKIDRITDFIHIKSDSEFMIKQLNQEYKAKNPLMKKLRNDVWEMVDRLNVQYTWVPRDDNLAGQVLENKKSAEKPPLQDIRVTIYCGNFECKDTLLVERQNLMATFRTYACPNDCGTEINITTMHPNYTQVIYNGP